MYNIYNLFENDRIDFVCFGVEKLATTEFFLCFVKLLNGKLFLSIALRDRYTDTYLPYTYFYMHTSVCMYVCILSYMIVMLLHT